MTYIVVGAVDALPLFVTLCEGCATQEIVELPEGLIDPECELDPIGWDTDELVCACCGAEMEEVE